MQKKTKSVNPTENLGTLQDLTPEEISEMKKPVPVNGGENSEIVVTGEGLSDTEFIDKVFDEMEKKDSGKARELTANYIDFEEFEQGEERNYLFLGFDTFLDDQGLARPAVRLMDKTRKTFICASVVTVKALQKVEKTPCPVRLKVNGKVKGKNGSYYNVNVFIL